MMKMTKMQKKKALDDQKNNQNGKKALSFE